MRNPVLIALTALVVVLLGSTAILFQKYQKTSADYAKVNADEQMMRHRYGQAINEIATIQDSLNGIAFGSQGAKLLSSELQSEQKLSQARGDEALARIAVIRAGIERTKDRIQHLDAQLKQSGVKVAGLQKMITHLRQSVAEREEQVAQLTGRVENLQTQVTGLAAEVEHGQNTIRDQEAAIEDKRRELGTIYYAIGSKKDLTRAGLVVSKGGVLGMGRTLEASGRISEEAFTPIDTDQQTVIRIPADKAKVLSDQPVTSYALQPVGKELELRILDPKQFRTVRHLVIVTT